jgi:hypothetical protein
MSFFTNMNFRGSCCWFNCRKELDYILKPIWTNKTTGEVRFGWIGICETHVDNKKEDYRKLHSELIMNHAYELTGFEVSIM